MNISSGENVFSSSGSSGFEDATTRKLTDTRIAVHVLHALNKDTILNRTVNSDIVLIMIGLFANVWISWGIGKHFQLISVYAICASLGRDTSRAMRHHLLL